jgi:predicted nucleotidyltransferase
MSDALLELQHKADREWPHLAEARRLSADTHARLRELLHDQDPSDTSIVVFGSLARGEYTRGSDLDWTLLIDGQADEAHYAQVQTISRILERAGFHEPGPTGLFGNLAFSHPILHQIGGQDDTNKNTTQRILLLLESLAIGKEDAHERVLRLVLSRYVEDDRGIRYGSKRHLVPQVLLNDIVRYWRTVTVDFVAKQRERAKGWALRNAKLRMSRKLIFVSGLLTCFSFELFGEGQRWTDEDDRISTPLLVRFLRERIRRTPLENFAEVLLRPSVQPDTVRLLLDAYDRFLAILEDQEMRDRLKGLTLDALGDDPLFREARQLGHRFQEGLDRLFFEEDAQICTLIKKYGVF